MPLKKYNQFIDPRSLEVMVGDSVFEMEVCENHEEGLSKRESVSLDGMIFIFDNSMSRSFHMKDCLIPLDIVFCNAGQIVKIYENCQPCKDDECEKYPCDSSDLVLEFPGGTCSENSEIKEGALCQIMAFDVDKKLNIPSS
jgi:uncharacterized membrane protein (UPF0127 family)